MVKLETQNKRNETSKAQLKSVKPEKHLHLRARHIELVQDIRLHARGCRGSQGHHGHFRELLTQFIQPLVVRTEVMTPLQH